ncbi:MAG: hypothetical protein RL514_4467 [Verrucomicrobiota bacterium]|jgi:hypothetical protein
MRGLILGLVLVAFSALGEDTQLTETKEARQAVRAYRMTRDAAVLDRILVAYVKHPEMDPFLTGSLPVNKDTIPLLIKLIHEVPTNSKLRGFIYIKLASGPESAEVVGLWRKSLLDPKEDTDVRINTIGLMAKCKWASAEVALLEAFELIGEEKLGRDEKWRNRILGNTINGRHLELGEKLFTAYARLYPTHDKWFEHHKQSVWDLRTKVAQRKAAEMKRVNNAIAIFLLCALSGATIWLLYRRTDADPGKPQTKPPPLPS